MTGIACESTRSTWNLGLPNVGGSRESTHSEPSCPCTTGGPKTSPHKSCKDDRDTARYSIWRRPVEVVLGVRVHLVIYMT